MNQDVLTGQWKQMRGVLKSWWGKFTDEDFDKIGGQKDKLVGWVQEKYGYLREKAQQEVDRHLQEYVAKMGSASGSTEGSTGKTSMQGMGQNVADAANSMTAKAQDVASTVANKASEATTAVGETMGSIAGTMRANVPQGSALGAATSAVADQMEAAGSYLQERGLGNMTTDLTALIHRYPVHSFLVSVGVGYLLARRN